MSMGIRFLAIAGLLACTPAPGVAQEWTEQQVVQRFLEQNPWTRDARARGAIAAAEAQNRALPFNPRIRYIREGAGLTEFVQAEQTIHWSGRLGLLRAAGGASARAAESDGALDLWEARTALRLAFYQALAGQLQADVYAAGLKEIEEVIRILTEREREGEIARFDLLRAERERAELEAEAALVLAETELDLARMSGFLPPDAAVTRLSGTLTASLNQASDAAALTQRALAARPDYRAETQRLEWFRFEQQAAARQRIPEPVISAGYKRADVGVNQIVHGGVVELSVPLPLFNRGQAEVSRFTAEQDRTAARMQILARQIQAAVEGSLRVYRIRDMARERFRGALADSGAALVRIARIAYLEGEVGILQLLDAYRAERDARLRMIGIELAVKEAQIELERVMGEELN